MQRGFALSFDRAGKGWSYFKRLLGIVFVSFLVWQSDVSKIRESLLQISFWTILLCVFVEVFALFLDALKQYFWLRRSGISLGLIEVIQIRFLGSFGNNFLPSSLASDVIRAAALTRATASAKDAWASTLMSRFQGLIAMFPLIGVGFYSDITGAAGINQLSFILIMVGFLLSYFVFINESFVNFLRKTLGSFLKKFKAEGVLDFFDVLISYKTHKDLWILGLVLSVIYHLSTVTTTWLIFNATLQGLSFSDLLLVIPLTSLITMIPVSVNGIGVQEFSLLWLLERHGAKETIIASSIVWHFVRVFATLPGAWYFFKKK
jgi:uncharacterized protein (TIRG00374 family)